MARIDGGDAELRPGGLPPDIALALDVPLHRTTAADARRLVAAAVDLLGDPGRGVTGWWDQHVPALAAATAEHLGEQRTADVLRRWGHLRDVGTIYVYDIVTADGPLDPARRRAARDHTVLGAALLEVAGFPGSASMLAELHHERIDGTGYPYGLTTVPLGVQLLHAADTYAVLRSGRSDQPASTHRRAWTEIERQRRRGRMAADVVAALHLVLSDPRHPWAGQAVEEDR